MNTIEINHLTKDYGRRRGVFDISFSVKEGEAVGFLGSNGAGKTTTIRHLMGFLKPQKGSVKICGMDCFQEAVRVQRRVGYLPGEIAFMDNMKGYDFIRFMAQMKQIKDLTRARELIEYLELDPEGKIKKMSKGMKQKLGLILAFMQDSDILLLDEPTSGLDPLMQNKFVGLIQQAKQSGKTILMSSHIFEEVEQTCGRVLMIKDGKLLADENMEKFRTDTRKHYEIRFANQQEAQKFADAFPESTKEGAKVSLLLKGQANALIRTLSGCDVKDITARRQTLEEIFLQYYGGDQS